VAADVPDYALMLGVPARQKGWIGRHGYRLEKKPGSDDWICPETQWIYRPGESGALRCLDWDEETPLPALAAAV
jgi:UDP-2-acetamido-3-amino-2,3-dideoxy-glucuronate N-acetyltransferase